jgi:dipeptidyl-peptidase-4
MSLSGRLAPSIVLTSLFLGLSAGADAQPPRLTIERLYSQPNLIGTAPSGFTWSADGRRLAFLWNDEGRNYQDVWVLDTRDVEAGPQRATWMPQAVVESEEDSPFGRAQAAERQERDRGVGPITFHPDGKRVLAGFRGDLWLAAPGKAPQRLTETEAAEYRATYAPDGSALAFMRGGNLWRMPIEAGEATQLTRFEDPDTRLSGYRWSPDGSRIAILETDTSAVPRRSIPDYRPDQISQEPYLREVPRNYLGEPEPRQRIGLLDASGGEIRWIDLGDPAPDMILSFRWSPDSQRLAIDTSDFYAKDRRIFVADPESGEPAGRVVARDNDRLNETFYYWRLEWALDSSRLYFLSDRKQDFHVWSADPSQASPTARQLTSGSWAVSEMHPVEGGLIVVGNRGKAEERHMFRVGHEGGRAEQVSRVAGTHSPTVSPDGLHAAVAYSSDSKPPDLILTTLGEEVSETRITTSPLAEFKQFNWVTPKYVTFESHVDGTTLNGRLTLPPDFDPKRTYPAIVGSVYTDSVRNQWGGRTAHPTWGLDQFLAQEGYVLLNVDMRGSWGRGREHRRGIRLDYGGMDIEDLESGVRFLGTLGYVDTDRVGLWGSSYGGLMTAMSLFRKPGLYAAGIAGAPATNVWHALTGQMAVMMRPEDQPEEYADSSAFLHADGLEDPLMIIHGMQDWIVLYKDSLALVQRLIMLDKDVDLVTLPKSGHGWDNEGLAQTRFAFRKMVDFFDRHLAPEGQ